MTASPRGRTDTTKRRDSPPAACHASRQGAWYRARQVAPVQWSWPTVLGLQSAGSQPHRPLRQSRAPHSRAVQRAFDSSTAQHLRARAIPVLVAIYAERPGTGPIPVPDHKFVSAVYGRDWAGEVRSQYARDGYAALWSRGFFGRRSHPQVGLRIARGG